MIKWSGPVSLVLAGALSTTGVILVLAAATPTTPAPVSGTYHATAIPTRILSTRDGVGVSAGAIAAGQETVLQVTGLASVPTVATAVVLNVTVTEPTSAGFVTVYPDDGGSRPVTSNLNFVPNQTVPALVVVKVPSDGKVRFFNGSGGSMQLLADVSGYFTGANAPSGQGGFGVLSPGRLLDTRDGTGAPKAAVAARGSVAVTVTGNGVPLGVSAVVLNVTVTEPVSPGYVTAYPDGGPIPTASNLNFVSNQTVPNLVVVPVGGDGKVCLFNGSMGTAHLLADVSGYFLAGDPVKAGALGAVSPVRLLDTRTGVGAPQAAVAAGGTVALQVTGRGGVPASGVTAVVLNVTATEPTGPGSVTVYDDGPNRPTVSNLNYVKGQVVPNLVIAPVGAGGKVAMYNGSADTVQLVADVSGYILNADVPLPATSTSRYVRNISGAGADVGAMQAEGCADAQGGSTFVLLDIGAQSNADVPKSSNGTVLSPANPGVRLTVQSSAVRLSYPQLRTALDAYTLGYSTCSPTNGTVAIGTNTSGVSGDYPAAAKGTDWANEVVDKLVVRPRVTLAGADDVEASFGDTAVAAATWETSYLAGTTSNLVYTGSADNCPVTFGSAADCGAVSGQSGANWTRANYAFLTQGLAPGRITALPQIYYGYQAVQWANIDVTAGDAITFAGVSTENASACGADCAMTPSQGWAALYHSISTVVTTTSIPVVTDLRVDS